MHYVNSFKTLKSAPVEMINLPCRNASLSGLNINSCVIFQGPLLSVNKNNERLLTPYYFFKVVIAVFLISKRIRWIIFFLLFTKFNKFRL